MYILRYAHLALKLICQKTFKGSFSVKCPKYNELEYPSFQSRYKEVSKSPLNLSPRSPRQDFISSIFRNNFLPQPPQKDKTDCKNLAFTFGCPQSNLNSVLSHIRKTRSSKGTFQKSNSGIFPSQAWVFLEIVILLTLFGL